MTSMAIQNAFYEQKIPFVFLAVSTTTTMSEKNMNS